MSQWYGKKGERAEKTVLSCIRRYGMRKPFSAFDRLCTRGNFPMVVKSYLRGDTDLNRGWRITGMKDFLSDDTALRIIQGRVEREYSEVKMVLALEVLGAARREMLGENPEWDLGRMWAESDSKIHYFKRALEAKISNEDEQLNEEEETMENEISGNAARNELVALMQHHAGATFIRVTLQSSRLQDGPAESVGKSRGHMSLTYKDVQGLGLKVGDTVLVQYKKRLGIGVVDEVLEDVPDSNEYDYSVALRNVISKIDPKISEQLDALDKKMLKTVTQSEAQDRMERLTRQLGIDITKVTLELPSVEG